MLIIGTCLIRNKPDSYCQAHEGRDGGESALIADLTSSMPLRYPGEREPTISCIATIRRKAREVYR